MIVHAEKEELERQYQTEGVRRGVSSCIAIGTMEWGGGGLRQCFRPLPIWGACAVKNSSPTLYSYPHFILPHSSGTLVTVSMGKLSFYPLVKREVV